MTRASTLSGTGGSPVADVLAPLDPEEISLAALLAVAPLGAGVLERRGGDQPGKALETSPIG